MLRAARRLGLGSRCQLCGDIASRKVLNDTCIDDFLHTYQKTGCLFCLLLWAGITSFVDQEDTSLVKKKISFDILRGEKGDLFLFPIASKSDFPNSDKFPIQFYLPTDGFGYTQFPILRNFGYAPEYGLVDSKSDECIDTVRSWLSRCTSSHERCRSSTQARLPKRVLDLEPSKAGGSPRLYETQSEYGQYVALSHCWGGYQSCKTETTNIGRRREGIDLSEMPQNFRDAVFLTMKLGVRYLWIDSLCIIQDDKQDWQISAAQMTSIYRDSYLTVAASVAPNSPHGFLIARPNAENHRGVLPRGQGGEILPFPLNRVRVRRSLHDRRQKWLGIGDADPLDSRLWALQERLMPTRVLSYRHKEMTWECKTAQGCECYGLEEEDIDDEVQTWERELYHELVDGISKGKKKKRSVSNHHNENLFRWWYRGLQTVTSRSLTFDSDRLPAISGIAGSVQAVTEDTYLAGIWKSDLPNGLRWRVNPWKRGKKMAETGIPESYRAPSWTWSSVTATIVTPGPRDNRTARITVIDAQCIPATSNNPFGWTSDGYIELEGYVFPGKVTRSSLEGKASSSQTKLVFSDIPSPLADLKIDTSDFRPDTILVEAQAPVPGELDREASSLPTVTRSNLSWYLDSAPTLDSDVQCLLLNTSNGDAFADASDFIVVGRSLRVPGAWERVGFVDARMKSPFRDNLSNVIEGLEMTRLKVV